MDAEQDAYTVEEFARRHRIGRTQVFAEIKAGRLVARKVNSNTRITKEDAAAWRLALPKMQAGAVPAAA
jgi:hypothetical protein